VSAFIAQTSSSPTARSKCGALASERQSDHAQAARREYERELLYAEVIEHLRAITGEQDVTQHELATRLGVSDARVSRTMSGRENLTLRTLADIGWALGMRFEMVAVPFEDRTDTPARDDPEPPRWLHRHAQLVARRVRDALKS
jgi:transcriptional regulator with XRE-family HTH domain